MPNGYTKTPGCPKYVEIFNITNPDEAWYGEFGVGPFIRIITERVYLEIGVDPENQDHWIWYIQQACGSPIPALQGSGPNIPDIAFDIFRDYGLLPPEST